MTNPDTLEAGVNTDRELWRETHPEGDAFSYYSPRVFVTEGGGIGIDVGGNVIVKSLRDWHALAALPAAVPPDLNARTLEFVARWAWRDGAHLSDEERLSAIKYHPVIKALSGGGL